MKKQTNWRMRKEDTMLLQAKEQLKQHFGYEEFRGGQEEIISSVLSQNNTLGIMPTGGGKSICYQNPCSSIRGTNNRHLTAYFINERSG
ncbi:hypothetical protein [Bacillus sp. RAR_GA_16]|uniref:hypothetical protein n=1 Tax=Bacillus sp. RAR_GA_16 TaxID=2876774 RepID=UPI00296233AB|nr:hypothetical protein [Bacillus sp. RAR_GA_16]